MFKYSDITNLALLYHLNSEPWLNTAAYNDPAARVHFDAIVPRADALELPPPDESSTLRKVLHARRSCRDFAARTMSLATVSALLSGAYGALKVVKLPNDLLGLARPVPSAGGLYPLELYVATTDVEGLGDHLYHYNSLHHVLEPLATASAAQQIGGMFLAQYFLMHANLIIMLAAQFKRTMRKYGPRGYRYILIEAGHVAQNVCLLAAESGLGSLCVGGYRDGQLNRFLGFDDTAEAVVYCIAVGHPAA